jgi:hypothetical protein
VLVSSLAAVVTPPRAAEVVKKVVKVLPQSRPQRKAVEAEQKLIQLQRLPQQAAEPARRQRRLSQLLQVAEAAANSAVCTINVPDIAGWHKHPANQNASRVYMEYCGPGGD